MKKRQKKIIYIDRRPNTVKKNQKERETGINAETELRERVQRRPTEKKKQNQKERQTGRNAKTELKERVHRRPTKKKKTKSEGKRDRKKCKDRTKRESTVKTYRGKKK